MKRLKAILAWHRNDEITKAVLAVAMALVTTLATGVAYLQQDASINAGVAQREAERIGTAAMGDEVASLVQGTADFGVFRRWFEALEAANWAYDLRAETAPSGYDDGLLAALQRAETSVAAWASENSDLLKPPYFNPETYVTDFAAYHAATQVAPQVRAALEAQAQLDLNNEWDSRSSAYVTILTLLAVSLFFFGLASTMRPRTRRLFALTGASFVLVSSGWAASLALGAGERVPDAAIDAIVTARKEYALVTADDSAPLAADDVAHFEASLAAADTAVSVAPGYAAARLARAEVSAYYANALVLRSVEPARCASLLAQSQADFRSYLAGSEGTYAAWWNLGWVQILARDPAAAIASTDRAIALAPTHFALYLNRAIARLQAGDEAGAVADTARALEVARDSDLESNARFFAQSEMTIDRLSLAWPDQRAALAAMGRTLREGQVSLKVLALAAPTGDPAEIDSTYLVRLNLQADGTFSPRLYDKQYEFGEGDAFASADANGVRLFVTGAGISPGTIVSVRVWHDGILDAGSSSDAPWTPLVDGSVRYMTFDVLSPYGEAGLPLAAGDYHLEVYLDGHTRSQVDWTVSAN